MRSLLVVHTIVVAALAACGGSHPSTPTAPTSTAPAGALGDPRSETIGGITLGDPATKAIASLGEPQSRSPLTEEGATGELVSLWNWPGVELQMTGQSADGPLAVRAIRIEAPSKLTTSRGVGVGAPRADVERLYHELAWKTGDEGPEPGPDQLVVGTVYGGTMFRFDEAQRVSSIFVGAAAE